MNKASYLILLFSRVMNVFEKSIVPAFVLIWRVQLCTGKTSYIGIEKQLLITRIKNTFQSFKNSYKSK